MARALMIILIISVLCLPGPIKAQEKKEMPDPSQPMCPMMKMMKMGQGMMKGPEKWWQRGGMSQLLVQLTEEASEILASGNLKPEGQKKLAAVIKKLGELIPEIFSPHGPQKPEELQKQLREMQGVLDKIKLQTKGG